MMSWLGYKYTIIIGLVMQAVQLTIYGIWSAKWLMWLAGLFTAMASIIYPAISALVSKNASSEQQGVALGILTGMRGLCNGLGPAVFGLLFYLFSVSLSEGEQTDILAHAPPASAAHMIKGKGRNVSTQNVHDQLFMGVPFLFGVIPVLVAILFACCIKDRSGHEKKSDDEPFSSTTSSHNNSPS